jgi:hypothetical protein
MAECGQASMPDWTALKTIAINIVAPPAQIFIPDVVNAMANPPFLAALQPGHTYWQFT